MRKKKDGALYGGVGRNMGLMARILESSIQSDNNESEIVGKRGQKKEEKKGGGLGLIRN